MPAGFAFSLLPVEVRLRIYFFALSWPNLSNPFAQAHQLCQDVETDLLATASQGEWTPKSTFSITRVLPRRFTTPSCLLLCRQITVEARPILYAQLLTIDTPPPYAPMLGRPMDITSFICDKALQNAQHITLKMDLVRDPSGWRRVIDLLLDIWTEKNSLVHLHVISNVKLDRHQLIGYNDDGDGLVPPAVRILAKLHRFGSVVSVSFEGWPEQ